MEEDYWALFCATGAPLFYLLYRREKQRAERGNALTAWNEKEAAFL